MANYEHESHDHLKLLGVLKGHSGAITAIATSAATPNRIISASRDNTIMVWNLNRQLGVSEDPEMNEYGTAKRSLIGHNHIVQDVVLSSDGQFALSASWDHTLRLWDLNTGKTTKKFFGHTKDVLSVAFSPDNRQIVSGSRDKTIKLWNTLGECKFTIADNVHTDWVSCVKFSPNTQKPQIVSAGWDKLVKVWDLTTCKLHSNLVGHTGQINSVSVSPDGSLCASGGKDGTAMLWDLNNGQFLYSLDAKENINALTFSPNRYWLCAATENNITIWDLENKTPVAQLAPAHKVTPTSIAWSSDGTTLFAGYSDNVIRVWEVCAQ